MLYYKIFKDYTNYISIDETELEKAIGAFKLGTPVLFNNGAMEKIDSIIPDYNRSMGWNPSYKLEDDDWNDLRNSGTEKKLKACYELTVNKIEYLIETGRKDLIGKNADIALPAKSEEMKQVSDATKMLADKFRA